MFLKSTTKWQIQKMGVAGVSCAFEVSEQEANLKISLPIYFRMVTIFFKNSFWECKVMSINLAEYLY